MSARPSRPSLTMGTMMLWVAVVAVLLVNLRVVAITHREDVIHIWKDWTGTHTLTPTPLRWSDTPNSEERP
jgi:cytochrome c-type biogenesis protein CcmH/NrfF